MNMFLSRRQVLASSAAAVAFSTLPKGSAVAVQPMPLTVERRTLDVNGRAASVFGIQSADGSSGAVLAPGQRFTVALGNRCGAPAIIHWHGQTPPVSQDGVPDTGYETLITDGGSRGYDYAPRTGTHWMHSHYGLQEQLLMAAPMIVHTAEDLRLDAQEVVVLLHDFTFKDPAEILAGFTNGQGGKSVSGYGMGGMMGGGAMGSTMGGGAGGGMGMDLNDVNFDAYLANDRTLDDPQTVRVEAGGQVRLRLINGATATAFWINLGTLGGQLIAVDGNPVRPVNVTRFPLAGAQRADVLLRLPAGEGMFPVLAQREGGREQTGIILALSLIHI